VLFNPDDYQSHADRGVRFLGLGGDSVTLGQELRSIARKAPKI